MENDYDDDQELEQNEEESTNSARQYQRKLEKELKEAKEAAKSSANENSELLSAKRELALIKAGIDTAGGTGALFAKSYDGELTVEAIRTDAEKYGLIPTSQTSAVAENLNAQAQIANTSASATPSIPTNALDEIRGAKSEEEVLALVAKYQIPVDDQQPEAKFFSVV